MKKLKIELVEVESKGILDRLYWVILIASLWILGWVGGWISSIMDVHIVQPIFEYFGYELVRYK